MLRGRRSRDVGSLYDSSAPVDVRYRTREMGWCVAVAPDAPFGPDLRRGAGGGVGSKGSMGSSGSKRLLRLLGRPARACGSRRISRGGRPRRSGSRGNLPRRGGSGASNSRVRVGRRRRARSPAGSAASSSGGRIGRVRDAAGRLAVLLLSDEADLAERSTACSRCFLGLAALSTVPSSAESRFNIDASLAANPSRPPPLVGSASAASVASATAVARERVAIPRYHRIRPISSTPAEVKTISGKRSIKG